MKRARLKKLFAFLLSLALLFSMAFSVYAQENTDKSGIENMNDDIAIQEDSSSNTETPVQEPANVSASMLKKADVDEATQQSFDVSDSENTSMSDSNASTQPVAETDVYLNVLESKAVFPAIQADTTDEMSSTDDEQFDITPPTIEKIEFPQQGQTLKVGDTVSLYVYAYDTETAEGGLKVTASLALENSASSQTDMAVSYDAENKRYECNCILPDSALEKIVVSRITVDDKYHSTSATCHENKDYIYWFFVEQTESTPLHAKSFILTQNGQTLDVGDRIGASLETVEVINDSYHVYAVFQNVNNNTQSILLYASDSTHKNFSGSTIIDSYNSDGEWTLKRIYVDKGSLSGKQDLVIDDIATCGYTIMKNTSGTNTSLTPTIKSVSLDNNGEMLSVGDKVTITVSAEAGKDATLRSSGSITFMAASSISDRYKSVDLTLGNDGIYQGVFEITEDTYPCEWYVNSISIYNTENNSSADYAAFTYLADYPYYVNVKNGNTFVIPTQNVYLSFSALDENGEWKTIQSMSNQKIGWRQSLKECGISFPDIEIGYPGFTHMGWINNSDKEYTEDTPIVNTSNLSFYAKYDKKIATASYRSVDESGTVTYKEQKVVLPSNATYGDLRKAAESAAVPESVYPGLIFQKWEINMGSSKDEDIITNFSVYTYVNAVYDKNFISNNYTYIDTQGNWVTADQPLIVEKGTTYATAIAEAQKYMPKDITKAHSFEQWECRTTASAEGIPNFTSLFFTSKYAGKTALQISQLFSDEKGFEIHLGKPLVVDEGTTGDKVIGILNNWEKPIFYPGLRFKKWNYYGSNLDANTIVENGQVIAMNAQYENHLIRYLIYPDEKSLPHNSEETTNNCESIFCQVVDIGDTVTFPKTFEGYETVTWSTNYGSQLQPGDTFTVEHGINFYGYGTKTTATPETPEPEIPTNPENPPEPEVPDKELPDSAMDELINSILTADNGTTIPINMEYTTVVSKEILEAAKGKDVNIQLNMNGYTWTINGMDIIANDLKNVDLEVILDTNNIPNRTLQMLAGSNPLRQLSLVHEGDFGFKSTLTVNIGAEHAGKHGNLYYHDSVGKMVFIDAGKINADGNVNLTFSHASDYAIVISDKTMSQTDVPSSITTSITQNRPNNQSQPPKTGDPSLVMVWIVYALLALGSMVVLIKKSGYSK